MVRSNRLVSLALALPVVVAATLGAANRASAQPPALTDPGTPPAELAAPPPPPPPAAVGPLKLDGNNASIKLGFLAQPGFEYADGGTTPATNVAASYFFLRRARLMLGMTLGSSLEFFAETDSPNLGKRLGDPATPGAVNGSTGMNIQDAFATWKLMDEFKIDIGMMLIPLSHNGLQGATTLYGLDYFAFSFQQSGPLGGYIGRDDGIQARGLVNKKLEYRLGLFTGRRATVAMGEQPSRTAPRIAARVQYNIFDAETAFFYGGTYGGAKRVVSVGAGLDIQKEYKAFAADAFFDWPLGLDVVTWQLDFVHYDGGTWAGVANQNDIMLEGGYRIGTLQLSPILRFEMAKMDAPVVASPDLQRISFGVAYWYMGHNANVKLFYTHVKPSADGPGADTLSSYNQINLQTQFFIF